jgi:hypothetical protein
MSAVIVSALQIQRARSALHALLPPACVARHLTTGTGEMRTRLIGTVGVEIPLNNAGRQSVRRRLQSFEVEVLQALTVYPRLQLLPKFSGQAGGECGFF